jgi:ribosomal protein L37AE/L43A
MNAFEEVKRRTGAAELHALFDAAGLVLRGSGRNRARCPRCQDGSRDVSIGERGGIGVWRCHHCGESGSAVDFVAHSRGISVREAVAELERMAGADAGAARSKSRPPRVSAPEYPPASEVFALWNRCLSLQGDPEVAAAWKGRGINVALVESLDLARVLPRGAAVPRWAWGPGGSWSAGPYRLLVPMFDHAGRMVSLHARIAQAPKGTTKALSPCGYQLAGSIMADGLGRRLLAGDRDGQERVHRGGVLIAEGVPDFLAWATHLSAADEPPALFGAIAGSWTAEIAARIPDRVRVGIATHEDAAGEKYAQQIARTIAERCQVVRIRLQAAA